MKKFLLRSLAILLLFSFQPLSVWANESADPVVSERSIRNLVEKKLKKIPAVKSVKRIEVDGHFIVNFEVLFEQKTDPSNPDSETFLQRVYLGYVSKDAPVIIELNGYESRSAKPGEIATLLDANQIVIEHRYFGISVPKNGIPWETLTLSNAAHDQHLIINALKEALYPDSKFLSTGISKGGQTTMIHRSMYPEDVDASACYVAPLNFQREDPRIYDFLKNVSSPEERNAVKDFQLLCFQNKDTLISLLKDKAEKDGFGWDVNIEKAFELYVLEYSFAFWQWGAYEVDQIPKKNAGFDAILTHLLNVSGISFFSSKGVDRLRPFFWAALTEMGIYGYEHEPFAEYLSEQRTYKFDFTFPEGKQANFNPAPMRMVNEFIQQKAEKMLFIYGEYDTWSATGVELGEAAKNRGLRKYVSPQGHHDTRIRHFNEETRSEIISTIKLWMELE